MKKNILFGSGILVLILVLILAVISIAYLDTTDDTLKESVLLGYCPTMQSIAKEIASSNDDIQLVLKGSSADALSALNKGDIDIALIGRIAKKTEVDADVKEMILRSGYTLVGSVKRFIQISEQFRLNIHTAVSKEIASDLLAHSNIIYYDSTEQAIKSGLHETVLIEWKDYMDEYELIVIMDGRKKVEDFRIPVLYSYNNDYIENLDI